jgi:hypothetical protein
LWILHSSVEIPHYVVNNDNNPIMKPIIVPVRISLNVCLLSINLDQAISTTKAKKEIPIVQFIDNIKKDKKILHETCNELLIEKFINCEANKSIKA